MNSAWEAFETGWPNKIRYWCLHHIPWRVRAKMRLQEMWDRDE